MAGGGHTQWQTSFDEGDPLPGHSSTVPPPDPPPRGSHAQPPGPPLTVETLSFRDCRGGVLPDDALKETRRVNGVLSRLRQAQEQLPPKFMRGMVAPNQQIMNWARAGVPVVFVAAISAPCSPRNDRQTRPRELFRALVYALNEPGWHQSHRDLVARIKRASSCLARIQNDLLQQTTSILFDLVDLELLKDVNLFVDVLEQDARGSKVDPAASALEVVTDSDYLSPVLVCKPIPVPTRFIHTTRYQAWYEAQQVYYESTPSGVKLGWNTLILLRNSIENFCSHMAYGLRTHNRDHPDYRMTVVDLVRLVQMHPEVLDAPLAYALNCFQALNVCARTLRLYSIDYSYQWPEQEDLKGTIDEILDLLSKPAPALPHTIAVASYNQLRIESGLLADYSWMNEAFKMWNQAIEDMGHDIDRGLRPGHVYLMPGDELSSSHCGPSSLGTGCASSWRRRQFHPRRTSPAPTQDRAEQVPKRSRTTPESAPRPTSLRTTAASEAASSSGRPRPTVGSSTATPSTSEPEAPPPETTNAVLITHHFKVKSGKVYGTKVAKRRDGGGFMNAVDETPRPVTGKTFQQIYLRRLVTMLARSGGLSANVEAGFHLPTFILKGDEEWLRLYNHMYHRMHLGCTQCLPEPAVLAACVFDDRQSDEWIRPNFPGMRSWNSAKQRRPCVTSCVSPAAKMAQYGKQKALCWLWITTCARSPAIHLFVQLLSLPCETKDGRPWRCLRLRRQTGLVTTSRTLRRLSSEPAIGSEKFAWI